MRQMVTYKSLDRRSLITRLIDYRKMILSSSSDNYVPIKIVKSKIFISFAAIWKNYVPSSLNYGPLEGLEYQMLLLFTFVLTYRLLLLLKCYI